MDYDDWIRAGNGARRDESLEDAIGRTVNSAWNFPIACPMCGSKNLSCPYNTSLWRCDSCNHTWNHN
jgi:ribosomal protein L37AE/L43A